MLKWLEEGNQILHDFVWGPGMVAVFLFTGIYLTVKSGWFQVRHAKMWLRYTAGQLLFSDKKGNKSQIRAFCTALAATLGIGNITGVATALLLGGPGAIFWMWVSAFFGMMTAYGENVLGICYRTQDEKGEWHGGAMGYIERGLHCKWLAVIYAVCCIGVSLGMGNMTQANAMAGGLESVFQIPAIITALVLCVAVAMVLFGGTQRIGKISAYLVPFMAFFYLLGGCAVILFHLDNLPDALQMIFCSAFTPSAAGSGITGYCVRQAVKTGVARGIFSNEAGLGTSVMAHTDSCVSTPQIQGMWAIFEVFIDTMVVCTITALAILTSGVYEEVLHSNINMDGTMLAGRAFASALPGGDAFLALATALFAFATIVGWYYLGMQAVKYLFRDRGIAVYRMIYIGCILPGCVMSEGFIWSLADTMNGVMAIPNLAAVLLLSKEVT